MKRKQNRLLHIPEQFNPPKYSRARVLHYLMDVHDVWLEDGFEEAVTHGNTWSATWRWYGCKVLRFVGRF